MDVTDREIILHIKKATIQGGTVANGNWVPDGDWLEVPHSPEGYKRDGFLLGDRPQSVNAMSKSPSEKCAYTEVQFAEPLGDLQAKLDALTNNPVIVQICMYERDEDSTCKLHTSHWLYWAEVTHVSPQSLGLKVFVARHYESQRQKGGGRESVTANLDFGNQHAATKAPHGRVGNAVAEDLPDMAVNPEEWGSWGLIS
jgi:hypothetical protein